MKISVSDHHRLVKNLYQGLLHRDPEPAALAHWVEQLDKGSDVNQIFEQFVDTAEFRRIRDNSQRLFVPPGHFYSPIVNIEEVRSSLMTGASLPKQLPGLTVDRDAMLALWGDLLPYLQEVPFPEEESHGFRYFFRNPAFSYGDASILCAMLRHFKPRRLVEVGSGYSSACAMDTIDRHLNGKVSVSFIEPYPDLLIKLLGKETVAQVQIFKTGVQQADIDLFTRLEANDILFIDSTHVMKTGSDVCHEIFTILPALNSGVLIHLHDIFWPFEYGSQWILEENRSWNEIYGLRAFLMFNNAFEIVFFNDYFARHCRDTIEAQYPAMLKNSGGSIWLRKK